MADDSFSYRVEPDAAFADRLERDLLRQLAVAEVQRGATGPDRKDQPLSVVDLDGSQGDTGTTLLGQRTKRRRWPVAAAALLAVVLVVAGTVLLADGGQHAIQTKPAGPSPTPTTSPSPTTLPAVPGVALEVLPPEGAPPSTPETGELVARMWSHASAGEDAYLYVYADGRVIRNRYPFGWHEQRLTPEGVELVRTEILSTGLFDPDQPPPGSELGLPFPSYGDIEVRNQDRLVYVPGRQDQQWTNEFDRLHERLRNLDSWLPPNAWEDPTIRPYGPSNYAICLTNNTSFRFENLPPIDPSRVLSLLPAPAEDLLGGARHWRWQDLAGEDPATIGRVGANPVTGPTQVGQGNPHCFDVTTEQARAINQALDDAGIHDAGGGQLIYRFYAPDPVSTTVDIWFLPYLPHGVPALVLG